jgi:hypothetical protein
VANQALIESGIGCSNRLHERQDSDRLVGMVGLEPDCILAVNFRFEAWRGHCTCSRVRLDSFSFHRGQLVGRLSEAIEPAR